MESVQQTIQDDGIGVGRAFKSLQQSICTTGNHPSTFKYIFRGIPVIEFLSSNDMTGNLTVPSQPSYTVRICCNVRHHIGSLNVLNPTTYNKHVRDVF